MPYPRRSLSFVLLPALLAGPAVALGGDAPAASRPPRPNIVLILADDLDRMDLARFPNLSRLRSESAELTEFTVTDSWCCPSRATILRSQYVHSHNVRTNNAPDGGFEEFHARGHDRSTIGTWLKPAGYRTAFLGKFLNGYPTSAAPDYVPPGWDEWHVPAPKNMYKQRNYQLIEQGVRRSRTEHLDDVLARKARTVISSSARPFFLYLAPIAPHLPAAYAPRHADAFAKARAPRTPSFNKPPARNEPRWLRRMPKLNPKAVKRIDRVHRDRLRSMLAVDDMVGSVVETLRASGKLSNTYIFFTSDNGYHLGQHRLWPGKTTPFEEDVRVPALVRGPGVRPGRVRALSGTIDLAPTFTHLAGVPAPRFAEGRSLLPVLRRQKAPWRRGMLIEFYAGRPGDKPEGPDCDTKTRRGCPLPPTYAALRTRRHTYVEYATGERQFYDRAKDPYQLQNRAAAAPRYLHDWLARYRTCEAATCRRADRG